jgi:potassium-transporting ATPase potassium-binding subunit
MTPNDTLQIASIFGALFFLAPLLGEWIGKVLEGEKHFLRFLRPVEVGIYQCLGVQEAETMDWKRYAAAVLGFSLAGFAVLFLFQIFQGSLPLNPQGLPSLSWHLAFNTAASFVSNTNWQSYSGEATMGYFVQMLGLAVQNFLSAATGIAVLVALARGLRNKESDSLGNFWVDLTRTTLYILIPLSFVLALALIGQGVVQTFSPYVAAKTVEGASQLLPMGPAASQIAIKQLGTNGGGFFNVNSAHPFENPTPFSNWLQLLAILLIPAALPFSFGRWIRNRKHGTTLFLTMAVLLVSGLALSLWAEYQPSLAFGVGPLMEGKETRFGVVNSVVWSVFTSAASNGSVNAMHSSLSPLSGGVALFNIMLGEIIFGGVGSGVYGMVIFAILTVFLAGLMVGRTPEYLGKKVEAKEIKMAIVAVLIPNVVILLGAGISLVLPVALSSLSAKGPHGLTEVLYAFVSAGGNNGSAFAGLSANTPYYNVLLGTAMLLGRFGVILPILVIAGSLGKKKTCPVSPGTFSTESGMFVVLLLSVILIVGGLTFFPALSLGPIMEHFLWTTGKGF